MSSLRCDMTNNAAKQTDNHYSKKEAAAKEDS